MVYDFEIAIAAFPLDCSRYRIVTLKDISSLTPLMENATHYSAYRDLPE